MAMTRRRAVLATLALYAAYPAWAAPDEAVRRFVEAAHSSALFQSRISEFAASKDTRPEIKALAARVRDFRVAQLPELARLARSIGIEVRDTLDLELRSIVENMEPLDFLALSRRYAEVESQALDKEVSAYEEAARSGPTPIQDYASTMLPRLRDLAEAARNGRAAVQP